MTVAEICVSAYLTVGLLATGIIWTTLRAAAKRRDNRAKSVHYGRVGSSSLGEPNTKPSRSH